MITSPPWGSLRLGRLKSVVVFASCATAMSACSGKVERGTPSIPGASASSTVATGKSGSTDVLTETVGVGGSIELDRPPGSGGASGGPTGGGSVVVTGGADPGLGGLGLGGAAPWTDSTGGTQDSVGGRDPESSGDAPGAADSSGGAPSAVSIGSGSGVAGSPGIAPPDQPPCGD